MELYVPILKSCQSVKLFCACHIITIWIMQLTQIASCLNEKIE